MQQISLFDQLDQPSHWNSKIELSELFEAYFSCRSNKRNTLNALRFEADYEHNLIVLCDEINQGTYQPGKSIAFIVDKPVKREIFAADFRDRVVHHLVFNKLNPLFEKAFIHDSYACRMNKGTHLGIKRADGFIRKCSHNYAKDCYVLKLDIQGFFMHIDKHILFAKLQNFIKAKYQHSDRDLMLSLCQKIIYNDPTQGCIIKGKLSDWEGLPKDKSLFHARPYCGLPIGNLTSQVFANFYMNSFDHFIKHDVGLRFYGRYVDDSIFVHESKDYLQALIPKVDEFLQEKLRLTLHPKKIYLQHYSLGVKFLGVVIKPHRIYITNRTKGNFYAAIEKQNSVVRNNPPSQQEKLTFLSSINSYLGIMKHYKTYRLRKKMLLTHLSPWWQKRYFIGEDFTKVTTQKVV